VSARGVLRVQLERLAPRLQPFLFSSLPLDLFGDGSVLAMPLPGHTPGSVGYLVGDWLFVGDALWERGSEKSLLGKSLDESESESGATREKLRALQRERPGLRIVPAHDGRALEELPECGHARR
jgi:glyoxylase-like metal-dependent hydrolase (beta-lactamase superfamily II)